MNAPMSKRMKELLRTEEGRRRISRLLLEEPLYYAVRSKALSDKDLRCSELSWPVARREVT